MKPSNTTIQCPVGFHAQENPQNPAIIHSTGMLTYKQLDEAVSALCPERWTLGRTHERKYEKRAGFAEANSPELVIRLLAAWRMGITTVLLNPGFPDSYIQAKFHELNATMPSMQQEDPGTAGPATTHRPCISLNADATVILTSGSTGNEKAVVHSYGNHYFNALGSNQNITLNHGDRWLLSLPLFHVGGLGILFRTLIAGAAMVIPTKDDRLMDQLLKRFNVTHVSMVSTQLHRLLEQTKSQAAGRDSFSSLKAVLLGGSAFSPTLLNRASANGLPIHTTYGLSEMSSQVTTTPPKATLEQQLTSGKILKYRNLDVSPQGEILVSGLTRFRGYLEDGRLLEPFDAKGRFATGDLGHLDEAGYLHVKGRKDNVFISGGENIMPEEIENHLNRFPGIKQSVVVPIEDETYGFRPAAFLETEPGVHLEQNILITYLEAHLPRFKLPDVFYNWPRKALGETPSLKIKRPEFKRLLKDGAPEILFRKKQ